MTYVYLSGPMTGYPVWNYPAFHRVAAQLRAQGYGVHNPAEAFGGQTDLSYSQYMREDVDKIGISEGIVLLPGWRQSRGARFEVLVGQMYGLWIAEAFEVPDGSVVLLPLEGVEIVTVVS